MWNYVDVMTLSLHALILVLRIITICLGGDPYHNRLLEVVNHFYGITTLLLVLRFSSILEVNKTVGPLQLALFRMCIDLAIILIQFFFVIVAFSVAITMIYTAEISYLIPTGQKKINGTHFDGLVNSAASFIYKDLFVSRVVFLDHLQQITSSANFKFLTEAERTFCLFSSCSSPVKLIFLSCNFLVFSLWQLLRRRTNSLVSYGP